MDCDSLSFPLLENEAQRIGARIAEMSPCGVFRIKLNDLHKQLLYANDAFFKLRGYSRERYMRELESRTDMIIHPDDSPIVYDAIQNAQATGSYSCSVQIRVICSSGEIKWVFCGCNVQYENEEYIIDVIEYDITGQKRLERELAFKEQSLEIAFGQSNAVLCELDLAARTIRPSNAMRLRFDIPENPQNVPDMFFECGVIPGDFSEAVYRMHDELYAGAPFASCNIRMRDRNGEYVWTMVRYITIFDDEGWPFKAIGVFKDIQEEVLSREKSDRDPLTGILRRDALEKQGGVALEQSEHVAVLVLDIDSFKSINDHFGHIAGDSVLKCFAGVLHACLPERSIVGRLGGDEFMVCVPDVDMTALAAMMDTLVDGIRNMHIRHALPCQVTSSIGVGCSPEHGRTIEELYEHADAAQYIVKKSTKNDWRLCQPGDVFSNEASLRACP